VTWSAHPRRRAAFHVLSFSAGTIPILVGSLVLVGWVSGNTALIRLGPGLATMKANTALAFVLTGLAVWGAVPDDPSRLWQRGGQIGALLVTMLGGLTLTEYLVGWDLHIDQLLVADRLTLVTAAVPGRMAPATSFNFLLLGVALLLLGSHRAIKTAQALILVALSSATLALIGYAYGVASLYRIVPFAWVAVHTAATFIVVGVGVLAARPAHGVMRLVTSPTVGGFLARRLLPMAVVLPLFLGWLCVAGQRSGLYDAVFGMALFALATMSIFTVLIGWHAGVINRMERGRERAEAALRSSEDRFVKAFRASPAALTITRLTDGCFIDMNESYLRLFGYQREELLGQSVLALPLYAYPDERTEIVRRLRAEGAVYNYEMTTQAKSGDIRHVLFSAETIDLDGDTYILTILLDITERTRAEAALREREEQYRLITEHTGDLISLHDQQGRWLYTSPSFQHVLGYDLPALMRMSEFELVHPEDLAQTQAAWEQLTAQGTVAATIRCRHADGSWRWIEASHTRVQRQGQAVTLTIGHDITERKRLEAQFLQAQKMESIGRLAGGIAHDFNNLLTVIDGYADLAHDMLPTDHPIRHDLDEIRKAAKRAATLVQQLLAFARKQVIEPHVVNLNDLMQDMESLLRRLIGEDIACVTHPAPDLGHVKVDPGQIEQVIVNIAVNARDAMPTGGKLTLETANVMLDQDYARTHLSVIPGDYVLLAISDTGMGMDTTVQQHLFEPFFTTKAPGKGTGLGLATCYGIIKQHGGFIWVYSEVGHGTTIKIYLPRIYAPADDLPAPDTEVVPHGTETLLLVEDDLALRVFVTRVLQEAGFTVVVAQDGAEAQRLAQEYQDGIQLLVTDVVLPQISGKVLAEQLMQQVPTLKVLFMSGYADDAVVQHGEVDAGRAFLHKPFSPGGLLRKVRTVLDGAEAGQ